MIPALLQRRRGQIALGPATAFWLVLVALPWVPAISPAGTVREPIRGVSIAVITLAEAFLFALASRRGDLDARTRLSLRCFAIGIGLSSLANLSFLLRRLHIGPMGTLLAFEGTLDRVIWIVGVAALLALPRATRRRGAAWRIAVDTIIAVGALALALYVVAVLPSYATATSTSGRLQVLQYGALQATNVAILTVLFVWGLARPVRRAVLCLGATIVIETLYLVAVLSMEGDSRRVADTLFFLDHVFYLYAGVFFLVDAPSKDDELLPDWLRSLNPITLVAVSGLGLLVILRRGRMPDIEYLAAGLATIAPVLLLRVVIAGWENLRLERRQAEIERGWHDEKMSAVSRLAAGISHEFNNVLMSVMGHAELGLVDSSTAPAAEQYLQPIHASAQRAAALTSRLLEYTGRHAVSKRRMSVADIVRGTRTAVEQIAGERIPVRWSVEDADTVVMADAAQLQAALIELADNAVHAMANGGTLTVRLARTSLRQPLQTRFLAAGPGDYVVMEVADTGDGIAPGDLPHVFDPFFTTRPGREGAGLGLASVHGVATAHDAGLTVESTPGAGTRVRLYLPAAPAATATPAIA